MSSFSLAELQPYEILASLRDHICHVLWLSAGLVVSVQAARWIVAVVEDVDARRNWSVADGPKIAMDEPKLSSNTHTPIAVLITAAGPDEAFAAVLESTIDCGEEIRVNGIVTVNEALGSEAWCPVRLRLNGLTATTSAEGNDRLIEHSESPTAIRGVIGPGCLQHSRPFNFTQMEAA